MRKANPLVIAAMALFLVAGGTFTVSTQTNAKTVKVTASKKTLDADKAAVKTAIAKLMSDYKKAGLPTDQAITALTAMVDAVRPVAVSAPVKNQQPTLQPTVASPSLPQSAPVPPAPQDTTSTSVQGLAAIRSSGGVWENWNADMADDGPVIEVVYLDSASKTIMSDATRTMPVSADVNIYAGSGPLSEHERLVFSAHYTKDQIIFGGIYPEIRIPKGQINVNPSVDYKYGVAELTIHTPTQGDFSAKDESLKLFE